MITGGIEGVDYAFPPRPDLNVLKSAGKLFICRYGGPGTIDKQLDPAEALRATALSYKIVSNAEGSADGLLGGFNVGVSWARSAVARFKLCGMPTNRPYYFSADVNVTSTQWPSVAAALRGAASVVGLANVGLYGHYNCMRWARRDDVARWFWQTYAWSGGNWAPGNHIEQYRNGVTIGGGDCDLDRAINGDFGGWTVGGAAGGVDNLFSQNSKIITGDPNAGGAIYPSSGPQVYLLQAQLNDLPEVTPKLSVDGGHGPMTSTAINQATGLDGNFYGPVQYRALSAKVFKGAPGTPGSPGSPGAPGVDGKTPTKVMIELKADVVEVE